jgi:hypothetical protein
MSSTPHDADRDAPCTTVPKLIRAELRRDENSAVDDGRRDLGAYLTDVLTHFGERGLIEDMNGIEPADPFVD